MLVEGLLGHSELQYKFKNLERGVSPPPLNPLKVGEGEWPNWGN